MINCLMQEKKSPTLNSPFKFLKCDGFDDRFTTHIGILHISAETIIFKWNIIHFIWINFETQNIYFKTHFLLKMNFKMHICMTKIVETIRKAIFISIYFIFSLAISGIVTNILGYFLEFNKVCGCVWGRWRC